MVARHAGHLLRQCAPLGDGGVVHVDVICRSIANNPSEDVVVHHGVCHGQTATAVVRRAWDAWAGGPGQGVQGEELG